MAGDNEFGEFYTIPVILSFEGIDKQVNRSLGGAFKGVGQKAGRDLGKAAAEGVKASEADVKKAFDNHAKLADRAADATGKLKTAQAGYQDVLDKGIQSGKRYESAKAAAEKAARDEARAIRQATEALKDYEQAAKNAQKAGENAGGGFLSGLRESVSGAATTGSDAAGSFAEGFAGSSALLRLGSAGGPIGLALAAAGVVGGGLLAKGIMDGLEREPMRDLIQARLGATPDEMQALGRAAGSAYANNFYETSQEALSGAQLAVQGGLVSGALDPDLQNVTEKLRSISDLVGSDLNETTKSASILLRSGLVGSAEEAFDVIARGYQLTGDLGADWLDSISEYSIGWKNAGLTAEQSLALIKQGQDLGVDVTDRSADALREFGRRITEEGDDMIAVFDNIGLNGQAMYESFKAGGPEAFSAFDAVFDAIRGIEDPARRGQAVLAVLGDTAGDFSEAFEQWDPSAAVSALGSIEGAAQNVQNTMGDNVVGTFESAKRSIETSIDGIEDKLGAAFGPALTDVAEFVKDNGDTITGVFVDMAAGTTRAIGLTLNSFGDLAGGFGNVYGTILRADADFQRLLGNDDTAAEQDRRADDAFGWGEGLNELGAELQRSADDMDRWSDHLGDTAGSTDEAKTSTDKLGTAIEGLPSEKNIGINLTDSQGRPITPDQLGGWFGNSAAGSGIPAGSPLGDLLGPYANRPAGAAAAGSSAASGIDWDAIAQAESSGRWDDNNSGGHSTSSGAPRGGLQITDGTWNAFGGTEFAPSANLATKEQQIAVAERIAQTGHNGTPPQGLGAWEVVTQGKVPGHTAAGVTAPAAMPSGGVLSEQRVKDIASSFGLQVTSEDRPGDNGYHGQGLALDIGKPGTDKSPEMLAFAEYMRANFGPDLLELIHDQPGWAGNVKDGKDTGAFGNVYTMDQAGYHGDHVHLAANWGKGTSSQASLGSGLAGPATMPGLTNAYGADYEPGIGTPGLNELGEPGYYETDPRAISQADRRVQDTQQGITDADQAILDAKERRAELEKDLTTTAEERAKADREIVEAEKRAGRAREDAEWAQEDANEARLGKFKAAKEATTDKKSGESEFGELGGIASSFLKETFGIDLSNNPLMKMLNVGLNAFNGPLEEALGGGQPGLTPGLVPGAPADAGGGGGTSLAAFGLPDVKVPPLPTGNAHPGGGALPGPQQNVSIDASQHIGGNIGWDPAEIERQRRSGLDRAIPRIPVGS